MTDVRQREDIRKTHRWIHSASFRQTRLCPSTVYAFFFSGSDNLVKESECRDRSYKIKGNQRCVTSLNNSGSLLLSRCSQRVLEKQINGQSAGALRRGIQENQCIYSDLEEIIVCHGISWDPAISAVSWERRWSAQVSRTTMTLRARG